MLTLKDCQSLDSDNMLEKLIRFPEMLEEAHARASQLQVPALDRMPRSIVVCGMGGSAIGAELLRGYISAELPCPFIVMREARIPGFMTPEDLCVVCSYSGNTTETCQAMLEASGKGIRTIALTTGGKIAEFSERENIPVFTMPGGLVPRVALPNMFIYFWNLLNKCGICSFDNDAFQEMLAHLRELIARYGIVDAMNPALELAERLKGSLPIIYSTAAHLHPVAVRWKNQFCENAKQFSYVQAFPELMHNEVMGWELDNPLHKYCRILLLRDNVEPESMSRMIAVTRRHLNAKASGIEEYTATGGSLLTRMFSLVIFGDFVSYYLSILNGVDPTPIRTIDYIKKAR